MDADGGGRGAGRASPPTVLLIGALVLTTCTVLALLDQVVLAAGILTLALACAAAAAWNAARGDGHRPPRDVVHRACGGVADLVSPEPVRRVSIAQMVSMPPHLFHLAFRYRCRTCDVEFTE